MWTTGCNLMLPTGHSLVIVKKHLDLAFVQTLDTQLLKPLEPWQGCSGGGVFCYPQQIHADDATPGLRLVTEMPGMSFLLTRP